MSIDAEVELRQTREMADDIDLRDLRQLGVSLAQELLRHQIGRALRGIRRRQAVPAQANFAAFEYDRLVEVHLTSASALQNASMSPRDLVSVTHTSKSFP